MNTEEEYLLHDVAVFLEAHGWHDAEDEWYLISDKSDPYKSMIYLDKIEESRELGTLGELSQMTIAQLSERLSQRVNERTDTLRGRITEALVYVQKALEASTRLDVIKNIEQVQDILEGNNIWQ